MRFARFDLDGRQSYGLIEGDRITPISGSPFESWQAAGPAVPLDRVRLQVPVIPQNFYAVGLNYATHIRERAHRLGLAPEIPTRPEPGYRSPNALVAHDEPILLPPDATSIQFEGELVVVIGRLAKHVREADALKYVLGYTIGNDISERAWQKADRTFWRSKNSDTFKPMGPWIETDVDLNALRTTVRVNGKTHIEFATNDMVFGVERFIATITEYITLHPGDVIWMGTEGSSPNLRAGDVVEVEISSIGTLRNAVLASSGAT
jgi:2-keto-4-pentenoate hydratase/2-oxohepta-3-ene-1,7-dioic acid hydratase in catechol pathway